MEIQDLFRWMVDQGASDMHLKVGLPPSLRMAGRLARASGEAVSSTELWRWLQSIAGADTLARLRAEHEADFACQAVGTDGTPFRIRCNAFQQMGQVAAVFRLIPSRIPSLDTLGMADLRVFTERDYGIVLVTGPTGAGKSTTLAALIEHINETQPKHILTIEDPVEFVHVDKVGIVNQREVGTDTASFAEALRRGLRQDPDVILVGEMRDAETIGIAMTAAETGHLVLSTLHTNDAKQTIDRTLEAFPPDAQHQVRGKLAVTLLGVVSQRLLRRRDEQGRVAVQEVMVNSPTIRKLIEEGRTAGIDKAIEESTDYYGMRSMNQHLLTLWQQEIVSEEDALAVSNNPGDLRMRMQTQKYSTKAANEGVGARSRPAGLEGRYG